MNKRLKADPSEAVILSKAFEHFLDGTSADIGALAYLTE